MLDAGLVASRFLHYAAVLSLFGGALFPLYVFHGRHSMLSEADTVLLTWLRRVLFLTVFMALISGVSWFVFTTGSMAGDMSKVVNISVLKTMMLATDFGPLWVGRFVLTVMIAGLLMRWPFRSALWLVPLLAALLLGSLAGTGHARVSDGWGGAVHISFDAAHLLAAGAWLGGLWPLGVTIAASLQSNGRQQNHLAIREALRRFSGIGTIAVAILVASGLVNTLFLVDTPGALIETTYGRLLVAKVALFVLMASLAAGNRFWIMPRLDQSASPGSDLGLGRLRLHVIAEQVLGLFVLALVAVLGTLEPALTT